MFLECLFLLLLFIFLVKKFARKTSIEQYVYPNFMMGKEMHKKMKEYINNTKAHMVEVRGLNTVLLTHPDSELKYPEDTPVGNINNESIFMVNGDNWRHQRGIVNPAFHLDFLSNVFPVFISQTKTFLSLIGNGGEDIDIKFWMQRFTLDVLGEAVFGHKFEVMEGKVSKYQEAFMELVTTEFPAFELLFPQVVRLPLPVYTKRSTLIKLATEMTNEVIERKRKQHAQGINQSEDLLDALVNSDLTHRELYNTLWIFFIAGHETTGSTLSWTFYYLAKYPEYQKKMYEEIVKVLGDRDPTFSEIKNLSFTEMFLKEVLRIAPPFPLPAPRISEEAQEIDSVIIPPMTKVTPAIYTIHHHPDFWNEPDEFDPFRFSPENSKDRHPFSFLPFFLGRRHCVGMNFSMYEKKVLLAMVVRKFQIICINLLSYSRESTYKGGMFYSPGSVHISLKIRI